MGNAKSMLARVRRLERTKVPTFYKFIGSPEEFEAHARAGIAEGRYDPRDMPLVVNAVRRWLAEWIEV